MRLIVFTATILAASNSFAAVMERNIDIGAWSVAPYSDDQTGQFSHCAMGATYESGITLIFSVERDFNWILSLANNQWKLNPGAVYTLYYSVDGSAPLAGQATAVTPSQVTMPLSPTTTLFEKFRRGSRLKISSAGQTFAFNLTDSSKALSATLECTQRHVVTAQSADTAANPFVAAPQGRPGTSIDVSDRAEAATLIANVLSRSAITGFYILRASEVPKQLSSYDAVWTAPDVIGAVLVISANAPADMSAISPSLISKDAKVCKGQFASGTTPGAVDPGSPDAVHVFTACGAKENSWTIFYTAVRRPGGGAYIFSEMNIGDKPESAKEADTDISQAAYKVIRQ